MKPFQYFVFIFIIFSQIIKAQDTNQDTHTVTIGFPQVVTLSLLSDTGTAIVLKGDAPSEAGNSVIFNDTNSDIWINYSCSIIGTSVEPTKSIAAQITQGMVPLGLRLSVIASKDASQGGGTLGVPESTPVVLNHLKANTVIDGIGVSYTGSGTTKGHNLTYTLSLDPTLGSYALLDFNQSGSLTVTYTLSDN